MKRKFAITLEPAPILNTINFPDLFGGYSLPFDDQQLFRALEMIALKGEVLEIIEESDLIYQIKLDAYPVETSLYVDCRFVKEIASLKIIERKVPSIGEIQEALIKKIGSVYIWGGNDCSGIKKMLEFYPPKKPLNALEKRSWIFKGCDCSGLLYEVTRGFTPRNVCWLMHYGQAVHEKELVGMIDVGSCPEVCEMCRLVKPLDLFVWPGHVVIVLNDMETIESKCEWGGVVKTPLKERLEKILLDRKCLYTDPSSCTAGKGFVIRRWHQIYEG